MKKYEKYSLFGKNNNQNEWTLMGEFDYFTDLMQYLTKNYKWDKYRIESDFKTMTNDKPIISN